MAKRMSLYVFHPNLLRTSAFSIKLGKQIRELCMCAHVANSNSARVRVAGSSAEIDTLVVRSHQQFGGGGDGQILARQEHEGPCLESNPFREKVYTIIIQSTHDTKKIHDMQLNVTMMINVCKCLQRGHLGSCG